MSVIDRMKSLFTTTGAGSEITLISDMIEIETVVADGDRSVTRSFRIICPSGLPKADDPLWVMLAKMSTSDIQAGRRPKGSA